MNIPKGATHISSGRYYRKANDKWMLFGSKNQWIETACEHSWLDLNSKPIPTTWNGEGLPPIGTVCEIEMFSDDIRTVEVLGYDGGEAWLRYRELHRNTNSFILGNPCGFRPIKTVEQIAAEEREKGVNEMLAALRQPPAISARYVCEELFDLGYRKFEIVEEDV